MSKKPVIVYGRKKLATSSLPTIEVPSPEAVTSKEPEVKRQTRLSTLKDASSNRSASNVQLFSESLGDTAEDLQKPVANKGKKAAPKTKTAAKTTKRKNEPKKAKKTSKGSAQPKPRKKYDENVAPWAKSTVDFQEYENYSLAVTLEKSKIDAIANMPEKPARPDNPEEEPEPLLKINADNGDMASESVPSQQRFASTPAGSLKAPGPELSLGSAIPVLPASDDSVGEETELVGNAKLPTPRLPVAKYLLRSLTRNSNATPPSLSTSTSTVEKRRRKGIFSLVETPGPSKNEDKSDVKSIHLQKSVRFAESVAESSYKLDDESASAEIQTPKGGDWSVPSFIEGSGRSVNSFLSLSGIDHNLKSLDINTPTTTSQSQPNLSCTAEREVITQPVGVTKVMEDSLDLPSLVSLGPTLSILPEEFTAPFFETISHVDIVEDQAKTTQQESVIEENFSNRVRYILSPIAHVVTQENNFENGPHNVTGASEMGDVVSDLIVAPLVNNNKTGRFGSRVSVPANASSSMMNASSRLADISMRRKSLLVHEVSIDHESTATFDDTENFTKSRLAILTPVKDRRSKLQLSPLEKLLRACEQSDVLSFEDFFTAAERKGCVKIGEGVSGEVFKVNIPGSSSRVIKVIPVNGTITFNDAEQKTFADILAEVVVSRKTTAFAKAAALLQDRAPSRRTRSMKARESSFRRSWEDDENTRNASPNFIAVNRVCVVQGYFPPFLVKLWEKFASTKGSENDHPKRFDRSQHYLMFDSVFGGEPLENFKFASAYQALAIFAQVAVSLAVGEAASSFEHRDLHWGNILVHPAEREKLEYRIGSKRVSLSCANFEVSIIDFTLSRCSEDGVVVFTNLSQDEGIFMGEGDFQFEVYRLMRKECNDNWAAYMPRTNCFWLRYLLDKLLNRVFYKVAKSNVQHVESLKVLTELFFRVQEVKSATQFVYDNLIPNAGTLLEIEE